MPTKKYFELNLSFLGVALEIGRKIYISRI
jgi:hypothetical protein